MAIRSHHIVSIILVLLGAALIWSAESPAATPAASDRWQPDHWADAPLVQPIGQLPRSASVTELPHRDFFELPAVVFRNIPAVDISTTPPYRAPLWRDASEALPPNFTWKHTPQWEAAQERPAIGPWKQVAAIETWNHCGPAPDRILGSVGLDTHQNNHAIAFLDDHRFAIADGTHPIRIFDADTGRLLKSFGEPLPNSYERQRDIIRSDDGRLMLVLPSVEPKVWDTRTGECVARLPRFDGEYRAAAFLDQGRILAVFRGQPGPGFLHGNLQLWDLADHALTLRRALDVNDLVQEMRSVGPYLLLRGDGSQVLDTTSFKDLNRLPAATRESFLFLQPPTMGKPGAFGEIVFPEGGDAGEIRTIELPEGANSSRWKLPFPDGTSDDRPSNAHYTISPARELMAISRQGRVHFLEFLTAKLICTLPADDARERLTVRFLNEHLAVLGGDARGSHTSIYDLSTRREVAQIPDQGSNLAAAPDGKHIAVRRSETHEDGEPYYNRLYPPFVVLWKRIADAAAAP